MKGAIAVGAAVAVALLLVSPGPSPAGNRMSGSGSPEFGTWEYWLAEETGNLPSPESDAHPGKETGDTASPEFGTWEYWLAEETGTLPGSEPGSYSPLNDDPRGGNAPVSGRDSWAYWIGG